jgi:hypothetical protein
VPGPPSSGSGGVAAAGAGRRVGGAGFKISAIFHASSRRDSRSHEVIRVIRRKTNRRHMTGDHHGRTATRATLLVTAADEFSARTGAPPRPVMPLSGTLAAFGRLAPWRLIAACSAAQRVDR